MSCSLHPEAEAELATAAAFYKQQAGVALGSAFLAEFARVAGLLVSNPGLGTPTNDELRVHPMRRFPYSLVYRIVGKSIRILVIGHQYRLPGYRTGPACSNTELDPISGLCDLPPVQSCPQRRAFGACDEPNDRRGGQLVFTAQAAC